MKTMADPGVQADHGEAPVAVKKPEASPPSTEAPETAPEASDAALVRAFLKGSIIGSVLVFVLLGGLALALGMGIGPALGVGAFTAFWGGPGFGGMMGAVMRYSRAQSH